ncbi:PREDICTED: protein lin-9 homolog [Priapulus caudatus]|uniref:Protein lin-9 homolog n=1 Tax=Priapulus caudatus TaxID=37621 RepID=A0ABM1E1K3_PRICU|nr:PREDICTED: protein lin-9 homolog [Priapulus caudatus]
MADSLESSSAEALMVLKNGLQGSSAAYQHLEPIESHKFPGTNFLISEEIAMDTDALQEDIQVSDTGQQGEAEELLSSDPETAGYSDEEADDPEITVIKEEDVEEEEQGKPEPRYNLSRVRKKNRFYFNDDEDTAFAYCRHITPRKVPQHKQLPKPIGLSSPDKRNAMQLGMQIKNLLKLPKAHKWVYHELFYSSLDAVLFNGENEFCMCVRESFPRLKGKTLTKVEWCKIRRLMGKPRRCSPAFFEEEREALHKKRQKMRLLQQQTQMDMRHLKDLPPEIPMPLVIGNKVTARLRRPQDGLFTGVIAAVDTQNHTYRVAFDRMQLGTHDIPDYEVASNNNLERIPISAFVKKRPRLPPFFSPMKSPEGLKLVVISTVSLAENDLNSAEFTSMNDTVNEVKHVLEPPNQRVFQNHVEIHLNHIETRLSKILMVKKECISQLKDMNAEAERMDSYQEPMTRDFQRRYASLVLKLDKLNRDLNEHMTGVLTFCQQIAPEHGLEAAIEQPIEVKKRLNESSTDIVRRINSQYHVKAASTSELVTKLTSLMLHIQVCPHLLARASW